MKFGGGGNIGIYGGGIIGKSGGDGGNAGKNG